MNILITSAGRRVSLVKAFQKELKTLVVNAKVFAADANPTLSAACQIADNHFKVPYLNDDTYTDALIALCITHDIKLIIPTIDTELLLLAENRCRFEEKGIQVLVSDSEFIKKCRDKRLIHSFFESNGIQVAHEYSKEDYQLPLFIKPCDGSRSVDTFLIEKQDDFTDYHFSNDKLMFLEYLDHKLYTEFTCDLYYGKDNKLKCVVPRKRLEVRDGEVNKGLTQNNALVPFIKEKLAHISGAVGCLTVQFFVHNSEDKVYGIEINPRFGGGYPLSYLAGANYPKWIVEEYFLDKVVPPAFDSWEANLLMLRYDHEVLVHGFED